MAENQHATVQKIMSGVPKFQTSKTRPYTHIGHYNPWTIHNNSLQIKEE